MDLSMFRPSTLAAMSADLEFAHEEGLGSRELDLIRIDILSQLTAIVGEEEANGMIEDALAEI